MNERSATARRSVADRRFSWVLGLSLLVHAGAIGGAVFAQSLRPPRPEPVRAMPVELVRLGKPRDPKLLPRIPASGTPAPADPAAVPLETGKKAAPTPAATRAPKLSAAAERLLQGAQADALDPVERAVQKLAEPPEGREDGDPAGTASAANAASGYVAQVGRALKENYRLPETIPSGQRQFLNARVVLYLERDGRIARFEFLEKHPNQLFIGALEALLTSLKLPPPPRELARQYADSGLEVVFKP